jgi:hypothetical protein
MLTLCGSGPVKDRNRSAKRSEYNIVLAHFIGY